MTKRQQMHNLLSDLRYQLAPGAHTYSQCSRESCDNGARGGRVCADCLEGDIDRISGSLGSGARMWAAIVDYYETQEDLLSMAEELDEESNPTSE